MLSLWILIAVGIVYGSLFPFDFSTPAPSAGLLAFFLGSVSLQASRGDVLANLILYLPFGYLGMYALLPRLQRHTALLLVIALGAGLSFSIEIAQVFTAGRTTSILDFGLNILSTVVGAWTALIVRSVTHHPGAGHQPGIRDSLALTLAACWIAYRLAPFVPTIDFQHVKDALKPLLKLRSFEATAFFRYFVCWAVFAQLLRVAVPKANSLFILAVGGMAISLTPLMLTGRTIRAEEVAAICAITAAWPWLGRSRHVSNLLAALLLITVVLIELAPFNFSATRQSFSWLPLSGFVTGSAEIGVFALLEKFFLYGALVWLLVRSNLTPLAATMMVALLLLGLEYLQTLLPGRSPEITDPLLAIVAGWLCQVLTPAAKRQRYTTPASN